MEIFWKRANLPGRGEFLILSRQREIALTMMDILGVFGQPDHLPNIPKNEMSVYGLSLLVLGEMDLGDPEALPMKPWDWGVGSDSQVLLYTRPTKRNLLWLSKTPPLRVVYLGIGERDLLREVAAAALQNLGFSGLVQSVSERREFPPVLRQALRIALSQVPPSPEEAAEILAMGERPFIRTVRTLSDRCGCSPSYLSVLARRSGVSLTALLRHLTIYHGMVLKGESQRSWGTIGIQLGFKEVSAWSHFVSRFQKGAPDDESKNTLEALRRRVSEIAVPDGNR